MDLQLTRRGDYGVRAAVALAQVWPEGRYLKLREIAAEMSIPPRYTQEIVTLLVRAGLAEALAGKQGGYRLVREPAFISMLQVVEAAEGQLRLDRCTLTGGPCHWQKTCAVHSMLDEACKALTGTMRNHTLADVLEVDKRLERSADKATRHPASRGLRKKDGAGATNVPVSPPSSNL